MASKAFTMSSFDSIGWRIRRAVTRASAAMATLRIETRDSSIFHCGNQGSRALDVIQVAKASLSQMSSHQAVVTRSPNHMWANSCVVTLVCERRKVCVSSPGRTRRIWEPKVTRPTFSIAPRPSGTATLSSFSNGYGEPK